MTRPIDEKIVAMKMDNSDFKRKAVETTGIFGKLRQSLEKVTGVNLSRTTRELGDLASQTKKVDMDPLARSVQTISDRFSTLGVIGTTALVNITNRAVNAGLALQKSLTTDQIRDGFREYEMKMGSIGTMLANTEWAGTGLEDVKKTLSELNDYADQTIYSFAQMTQNIGRFTAAGVTLGDSTIAIKGLGNLAAISGSTSDQLNTAMYQMSQALSSGRLTLMDWNSMINAGMGGKKTQDALVETARAMGIAVDLSDGFRNSIQDGWLTSEVLLETLKQFGADKSMTAAATRVKTFTQMMATLREGIGSGWAETWELVFGDFEEATRLWTGISEALKKPFDAAAESRNNFLRAIIAGNGLSHMFSGIQNAVKPLTKTFDLLKLAFKTVFPDSFASVINGVAETFSKLSEGLTLSDKASVNIYTIFKGIFAIFSSVWEIVKALTHAVFGLLPSFKNLGGGLLDILASIARIPIHFNEMLKSGTGLSTVMEYLGLVLGIVGIGLSAIGDGLEWIANKIKPLGGMIGLSLGAKEISGTNDELTKMKKTLEPIVNFFKGMFNWVVNGFNWVKEKLVGFGQMIKDALPDGNELLAGGFIAALIAVTANAVMMGWKLWEVFTGWGGIGDGIQEVLEGVGGALNAFSANLWGAALIKVAIAVAILAGSFYMLQSLDYPTIAKGLYAMIGSLGGLIGALTILTKYNLVGQMASVSVILALSVAVAIMATAFKKMKGLDLNNIATAIYGIVGTMMALAGALTLMSKFGGASIGASALQILAIAGAVHLLVSAIERIAEIDPEVLKKGLWTTIEILAQLALFMTVMRGARFPMGATLGILAIGQAIKNIVSAVLTISKIDPKVMKEGLKVVAAILTAIGIFSVLSGFGNLLIAGAGMLVISFALQELMKPILMFAKMDFNKMVQGLFGMTIALVAIAAASTLMQGGVVGAIAISILAVALNLLVSPIMALSSLKWGELGIGLAALAGSLLIMSVAAFALTPIVPIVALFGAALGLMGLGMIGAGLGMSLFGTGLLTLSTLSVGAITTIIATIGTLLTGLISLAPMAARFLGDIMTKFLDVLNEYGPKLYDKMALFITNMLQAMADRIPGIAQAGADLIVSFLYGIASMRDAIILAAIDIVVSYIETMADAIETEGPRMTNAMMRLWGNIILVMVDAGVSMVNALFGWIPGVEAATSSIGSAAEEYIRDNFKSGLVGEDKGEEFASGIESTKSKVLTSSSAIAEAAKSGAESVKMKTSGQDFGLGFASGINISLESVRTAAVNMAKSAVSKVRDYLDIRSPSRLMGEVGSDTSYGFSNGIASGIKKVDKSANSLAERVNDFIGFPLIESTSKSGKAAGDGFAKGLESTKKSSSKSARSVGRSVGKSASEAFREAMEAAQYKFDMGDINAEQYVSEIKKIRDQYSKHTKLVREANLEIKRTEEDIVRRREELRRKEFENAKQVIDDKKYYNKLSLADELKSWEAIMKANKKGTEERKEAEREVYRLKNELNKSIIEINEEYVTKIEEANHRLINGERELNDEYEKAVSDRARTLTGFAGLFDKISSETEVSSQGLMNNLRDQVGAFQSWSNNLQSLANRGIDNGLLQELREMGPRSAAEIAALNRLTAEQLTEYTNLWRTKNGLARHQATGELEGMKNDTASKIEELRKRTQEELESYRVEWVSKIEDIRKGTEDQFVGLDQSMSTIGSNIISGLISGMNGMEGPLASEAKRLADSISQTIKSTLQIKSPSRVAMKDGEWFGEGLARGIADKVKTVGDSAKRLATTAKESLHKFIDGFAPEDNELHFRAVIDYDELDPNKFGRPRPMRIIPDTSFTNGMVTATKSNLGQNESKTPREFISNPVEYHNSYEIKVTANGNLSKSQIRQLAEDIQTEIKNANDRVKLSRGEGVAF